LFQAAGREEKLQETSVDLATCTRCDEQLVPLAAGEGEQAVTPHVFVDVRWEGHTARFPVRFDEKATLPLILFGRKATEGELIEYFLFGREPDQWDDNNGIPGQEIKGTRPDAAIDTRRILAYFVRRFVQAIPGIEAEIQRASYSRTALDAALRGPMSPLELAKRAFGSLSRPPVLSEPEKTAMAVGFQLTEILGALLRCRAGVSDAAITDCFGPVVAECKQMLDKLVAEHADLQTAAFRDYQKRIVGDAQ
jgi:hypothetical protein